MDNLWVYILIIVLILGGGCSLAGTWWSKNRIDRLGCPSINTEKKP